MQKPNVVEISASSRTIGSNAAGALRRDSEVPGIIYGPKLEANIAVAIKELELERILSVANVQFVRIKLENGESFDTLIKKVDFQPVNDRPLHVDFLALDPETAVEVIVPIKTIGTAIGSTVGGRIFQPMRKLKLRALPGNIPALVNVNISKMKIGSNLRVRHLRIDNVTILDDPRKTIATIKPPRGGKAGLSAEVFSTSDEDLSLSVNLPL
ncbi:50S ribosomal protein L25 [bacterium]|nr:MAG: 50S ribosomal protein L25 [bacterium]